MDNETEITEETVTMPTEMPEPETQVESTSAKPKSKKGLMIGIVAVAIVVILLISFMPMSETGVEGKWIVEEVVTYNPDGTVHSFWPVRDTKRVAAIKDALADISVFIV